MTEEHSAFQKKLVEEVSPSKRTLLDELNLPPKVSGFIKENQQTIKIAVIVIFVLLCANTFRDWYSQKKLNESAALLAQAMQQSEDQARKEQLRKVVDAYPGSGAALWSQVSLAQELLDEEKYGDAVSGYREIAGDISPGNPLYPLILHDLARAYELKGDYENALQQYVLLHDIDGFATIGYLGEGRIHEKMDKNDKARDAYKKALNQQGLSPAVQEWLEYKLDHI